MQTNFKKQEDGTLRTLIKDRDKTAEMISDLISHEFLEILNSGDYSTLAREYRRLNREIYNGRMRGWYTYMEGNSYPSEGEIRQQRRDIADKMLDAERREYES